MRIETDVDKLIELVSNVTESYTTAVFLADNKKRILKMWKYYSLGDNVNPNATIPFGTGPIGIVAETKTDFDLTKFSERDSNLLKIYSKSESIKSFFAVPIINKDGILEGVLAIDSKKTYFFSNKDQKLLKLFAEQFSLLLNNIRVQKFMDTETSDIQFLNEFCNEITRIKDVDSILQFTINSIIRLIKCDGYFISLKSNKNNEFYVAVSQSGKDIKGLKFSDQCGLAGFVMEDKKPFLLGNRKEELGSYIFAPSESIGRVRSFLGVPLLYKDEVLGLICLVDSKEDKFNQRDLQIISIMANNISLAITNVKAQKLIHSLSTNIDGLTGLWNFSGFHEHLDKIIQNASRKRFPISLMIIDIDGFTRINYNLGYEAGNEILRQFAKFLSDIDIGNGNIYLARYGSDEFALILPKIGGDRAFLYAEDICFAISNTKFVLPSRNIEINVSIGVSCFPEDSDNKNELIKNALLALSEAKSKGGKSAWILGL
ncbi:TPA: diguanylate cyclase [Candidatus Poribacteria bacterium]|nr:diguanylate cyclase [Candidatus Poribacteria bacterium]